jgi:hypothetical protein
MQFDDILNKIYKIRGNNVILDFDIAEFFGVSAKSLSILVKRNLKTFTHDYRFQLKKNEWKNIQTVKEKNEAIRQPFAFTEKGVTALSDILNLDIANEVANDIKFAFAFATIRALPPDHLPQVDKVINDLLKEGDKRGALEKIRSNYSIPIDIDEYLEFNQDVDDKRLTDEEILSIEKIVKNEVETIFNTIGIESNDSNPTLGDTDAKWMIGADLLIMTYRCKMVMIRYSYENRELNKDRKRYNKALKLIMNDPYTTKDIKDKLRVLKPKRTHDDNNLFLELAEAMFTSFRHLSGKGINGGLEMNKTQARKFLRDLLGKVFPEITSTLQDKTDEALKKAFQKIEKLMTPI